MLGSLARWLRILGFDVFYDNQIEDSALVEVAVTEGRHLLTQDRRLTERRKLDKVLLIESQSLPIQIQEVLAWVDVALDQNQFFSRCLDCNAPLRKVRPEEVKKDVPDYVFKTQSNFQRCPSCEKVFWPGTHRDHMLERLHKLIDENS